MQPYKKGGFRGGRGGRGGGGGGFYNPRERGYSGTGGGPRGNHSSNHTGNSSNHAGSHNARGGGGGGGGGPATQNSVSDILTTLLDLLFQKSATTLYNPESGMLNLSAFAESPDLSSVKRSIDFNSATFSAGLAGVIKDKIGTGLRALRVDNNGIRNLNILLGALIDANLYNGVIAISAVGNKISDCSFLGTARKFPLLGELLLQQNPVVDRKDYVPNVRKQLPGLTLLDGSPIQRGALTLPNPVSTTLTDNDLSVLYFLEQQVFAHAQTGSFDQMVSKYADHAVYSVSRSADSVLRSVHFDKEHNSQELSPGERKQFIADANSYARQIGWRNLHRFLSSTLDRFTLGRTKILAELRNLMGPLSLRFSQELNSNANVVFLVNGMKIPTCILTIHGKILLHWKAYRAASGQVENVPFYTCLFDRTMALTWSEANNSWEINNDAIFLRPDRAATGSTLVMNDESLATQSPMTTEYYQNRIRSCSATSCSNALFFANHPARVEQMRIRYLKGAPPQVVQAIVDKSESDAHAVNALIKASTLPLEVMVQAVQDPDSIARIMSL